jgi:ABC-type phosphate/phosphonate transport system permease subunit
VALAISGKSPYSDREFLLIFNIMLIGVMAVIVFSISETSNTGKQKFNELILFILSIITVIIDLIALSAIFYRLGTFGVTPNRLAVLGSNILILGNLVLIIIDLYKVNFRKALITQVELTISKYLPVYAIWILFVIIGFPLIFGIK